MVDGRRLPILVKPMNIEETHFWTEVRRRRNQYILWWLAWPPVGIAILAGYEFVFGDWAPVPFGLGLFILWAVFWLYLYYRLIKLYCPKCGKRAFSHPYFFMRDAKCRSCGYRYVRA